MDWGFIVAVCTGLSALSAALSSVLTNWWKNKREVKADEVAVLRGLIADLRTEKGGLDQEMKKLKDEHTACLIKTERLQLRVSVLEERLGILPPNHAPDNEPRMDSL